MKNTNKKYTIIGAMLLLISIIASFLLLRKKSNIAGLGKQQKYYKIADRLVKKAQNIINTIGAYEDAGQSEVREFEDILSNSKGLTYKEKSDLLNYMNSRVDNLDYSKGRYVSGLSGRQMLMKNIIKSYEFEYNYQYYDYIVSNVINGNRTTARRLFSSMPVENKRHFLVLLTDKDGHSYNDIDQQDRNMFFELMK